MSRKKKIAFCVILWALVFVVAESGMRVHAWMKDKPMRLADESLDSEWQWAREHLREGKWVLGRGAVYDPVLGWNTPPNLDTPDIETNSQGMRNREEFAEHAAPGRGRLLFVGDSYTYGWGVRNEETFPAVLDTEFLPEWDVLNMAVSGSGTDQQLVTFREYGRNYHPDVVILGFFVEDYRRNLLRFRGYFKPYYSEVEGEMRLHSSHIIPPQQLYEEYESGVRTFQPWYDSYLINSLARRLAKIRVKTFSSSAMGWKILEHIIEQFQESVLESGATPVWLIIPGRELLEESYYPYEIIEDLVEAKCEELGMLYLRLGSVLLEDRASDGEDIYRPEDDGGHFSAHGHRLVAKTIFEFLTEADLIKTTKR